MPLNKKFKKKKKLLSGKEIPNDMDTSYESTIFPYTSYESTIFPCNPIGYQLRQVKTGQTDS